VKFPNFSRFSCWVATLIKLHAETSRKVTWLRKNERFRFSCTSRFLITSQQTSKTVFHICTGNRQKLGRGTSHKSVIIAVTVWVSKHFTDNCDLCCVRVIVPSQAHDISVSTGKKMKTATNLLYYPADPGSKTWQHQVLSTNYKATKSITQKNWIITFSKQQ